MSSRARESEKVSSLSPMAENLAEEDEDEGFGDFKFVSFTNQTILSDQINGFDAGDDDEWGDFVDHSLPVQILKGDPVQFEPGPISSKSSHSFDSFGGFSVSESGSGPVETGKAAWEKPRGALPLSIFGDEEEEEEEEESGAGNYSTGDATGLFVHNRVDSAKSESKVNQVVPINDAIASLYDQMGQIKTPKGSDLNSNGPSSSSNYVGSPSYLNGLNSNSERSNSIGNGPNSKEVNPNGNAFDSALDGMNSEFVDVNEGYEDDVWEFKGADMETGGKDWKFEEQDVSKLSGPDVELAAGDYKNQVGQETPEGILHSSGVGNGTHGSSSWFAMSNGLTGKPSEFDIRFDSMPMLAAQNGLVSSAFTKTTPSPAENGLDSRALDVNVDADDDDWEFKDASSETRSKHEDIWELKDESSEKPEDRWEFEVASSETRLNHEDIWELKDETVGKHNDDWEFKDASSETRSKHEDILELKEECLEKHEEKPRADHLSQSGVEELPSNGKIQDESSESGSKHEDLWDFKDASSNRRPKHEDFWDFKDASSESRSNHEEESKDTDHSPNGIEEIISASETSGNKMKSEDRKGPLPLFFSDGMLDSEVSLNLQDVFIPNPTNNICSQSSNMPINDLISSLYSQAAAQAHSVDSTQNSIENGLDSERKVLDSDIMNVDDDFDDSSWEFKDAYTYSETRVEDKNPVVVQDLNKSSSNMSEPNDFVDFYTKLKDQLCLVVLSHIDALKNDKSAAALSNEGGRIAFDEEIQEAYKELQQVHIFPDEVSLDSCSLRHVDLDEFLEVLNQPNFHVVNSEFHLSRKLLLAEKELKTAIELLKHAAAMLKILRLGSEEQSSYVSAWSKMISACAQELKHGVLLWKQALQKNVQIQILSEPQGRTFILALGEIYRVALIIEASAKLYKPWMLLGPADFKGIFSLVEECSSVWSGSGLQEALRSLSGPIGDEYDGTTNALLESVQYIKDLDATSLQKHVLFQREPTCKLSLLTQGALPGMKLVVWNGEHYFLTVANLWANLVSCSPPRLPFVSLGP